MQELRVGGAVHALAFCLALIPTLAGTRRGLLVPGLRISEAVSLALLVIVVLLFHRQMKIGGVVTWALFVYASLISIVTAYHWSNSSYLGISDFLNYGLGPATLAVIYVVSYAVSQVRGVLTLTIKYLLTMAASMGILGVMQTLGIQSSRTFGSFMTGNERLVHPINWKIPRSTGVFHAWHAYASFMALSLLLATACIVYSVPLFRHKLTSLIIAACIGAGLISSLTFGMIILGAAGFSFFAIRNGKKIYVLGALVVVFVVLRFTPASNNISGRIDQQETASEYSYLPQTIAFRIGVWKRDYFPLIQGNLLFGHGPVGPDARVFTYVESMYIYLLLIAGIPALMAFIYLIGAVAWQALRRWKSMAGINSNPIKAVAAATFIFAVGLMPLMLIHPYMNDAGGSQLLIVLVGLSYVASRGPASGTSALLGEVR
jgi:hypothetical protein